MSRTSQRSSFRLVAAPVKLIYRCLAAPRWAGLEHLPSTGGFVLAANHLSELDPITVAYPLYHAGIMPRFLAKESLFRVPVLGALLRHLGQVPVHRGTVRAQDSLRSAVAELNDGGAVIVYPEGTLTRDPHLWPMRGYTGTARLALEANVPVVPMAHWGDQRILYRDPSGRRSVRPFPRHRVDVAIGRPLSPHELLGRAAGEALPETHPTVQELHHATDVIMDRITELLAELRGEPAPPQRFDARATGSPS